MALSVKDIAISELKPVSIFQSAYWAEVKRQNAWTARAFEIKGRWSGTLLVLIRPLSPFFSLAYAPLSFGRGIGEDEIEEISSILKTKLPKNTILIRYDLNWNTIDEIRSKCFFSCSSSVQPTGTVRLDLTGELNFKDRAKRNLKKEEEIIVKRWSGEEEDFDLWYDSYVYTSLRDNFSARSKGYIRRLLDIKSEDVEPILYLAWRDGEIVGGILNLRCANEEVYLFGSSIKFTENVSCGYSLQSHAILEAKAAGVQVYDLFGIEGKDEDNSHIASLSTFKSAFGGEKVYRPASFDYLFHPLWARLFRLADSLRFRNARRNRI